MKIPSYKYYFLFCFAMSYTLYADVPPNTVIGVVNDTVEPFDEPGQIVFTPDGTKAYVINYNALEVDVVDTATGVVTGVVDDSYSSFDFPRSLAITPDGAFLYVANDYMDEVDIVDVATNIMISKVDDGGSLFDYPISLSMTSDGSTLYCLNGGGSFNIVIIDVATNTATTVISGSPFYDPIQIVVSPDNTFAYVVDPGYGVGGALFVVDLETNTILGTVSDPHSLINVPYGVVCAPNGVLAYVANNEGNAPADTGSVIVIDIATQTVVREIISNDFLYPQSIAILPSGLLVYVSNAGDGGTTSYGSVFIIDTTTQEVIGTITDPDTTFNHPINMGLSSNGELMYVSNINSNTVSMVFTITSILPPSYAEAFVRNNTFLTQKDLIAILAWKAPTSGVAPAGYKIFREPGLLRCIGTVWADEELIFLDHNRQYGATYTYYIVSFDDSGNFSEPVSLSFIITGQDFN